MSDVIYEPRGNRDGITIPTIWVAIVLSLLLHVGVLLKWLPQIRQQLFPDVPEKGEAAGPLVVRIAPPPAPSPPPAPQSAPAPRARASPETRASRPKPAPPPQTPPVIALNQPAPERPAQTPAPPATPAPARP